MKKRLVYFTLSSLCFIMCVLIVKLFNKNQFVRGFIGDVIVILLIYFLVKVFYDFDALKLSGFTLAIAFSTEFLQYINFTDYLRLGNSSIVQLVLGAVFDPFDLIAYTIGAVLVYIIDKKVVRSIVMDIK